MFARLDGCFARRAMATEMEIVPPEAEPRALLADGFDVVSGVHLFRAAPLAVEPTVRARFFLLHGYNSEHLFDALVAHPQAGIAGIGDLRGRRVLVAQGASNLRIVRAIVRRAGVADDASIRFIPAPQARFAELLAAREADAAFALEPWATSLATFDGMRIVERGVLAAHMFGDDHGMAFFGGVIVNGSLLRDRLPALHRLREGWMEAYDILAREPTSRVRAMSRLFPEVRIAGNVGLPLVVAARDLSGTYLQQLQTALDMGLSLGLLGRRFDVTELVVNL